MTLPIILPAALRELTEAVEWYEARRPGLGIEFLGAVDLALRAIAVAPDGFPVWADNARYRRLVLDRFPHVVFFHQRDTGPEVVAVAHASRRPGYWLRRMVP
jgi:toxin ParE1/3/4